MRDLLPALTLAAIWITGVLLIMWRQRALERRRAERARRRRILRYLATQRPAYPHIEEYAHDRANVVPLDTYSRKV